MDQNFKNNFVEYKKLLEWLENVGNHINSPLIEGEEELMIASAQNPASDIQKNRLETFRLIYSKKKDEIIASNLVQSFNVLSINIGNDVKRIIKSNEELAKSNEKNQNIMNRLTKRIMLATIIQALAATAGLIITSINNLHS